MTTQLRKSLIQTRLDCAQRTSLQVRNLLERHPVVLLQDDCRSLFLAQLSHSLLDDRTQLAPRDEILDRLGRPRISGELARIEVFRHLRHGRAPLTPYPVAA